MTLRQWREDGKKACNCFRSSRRIMNRYTSVECWGNRYQCADVSDYLWERIPDYALLGLTSENTTATSSWKCQQQCLGTSWCRSINYYPNSSLCNLNSKAWGDDQTALDFVFNDSVVEYYYYCTRPQNMMTYSESEILRTQLVQQNCTAGNVCNNVL